MLPHPAIELQHHQAPPPAPLIPTINWFSPPYFLLFIFASFGNMCQVFVTWLFTAVFYVRCACFCQCSCPSRVCQTLFCSDVMIMALVLYIVWYHPTWGDWAVVMMMLSLHDVDVICEVKYPIVSVISNGVGPECASMCPWCRAQTAEWALSYLL